MFMPTSTVPNNSWKAPLPAGSLPLPSLSVVTKFSVMNKRCSMLVDFTRHISFNSIDRTAKILCFLVQIHPFVPEDSEESSVSWWFPPEDGLCSQQYLGVMKKWSRTQYLPQYHQALVGDTGQYFSFRSRAVSGCPHVCGHMEAGFTI